MDRRHVSSGAAFEERVGYSRAVRAAEHVWVSGTAPIMPEDADPPDDVVRTRIYLTRADDIEAVGRAHRESFARARPATTGIVTQLLDPRWRVEIEAEAVIVAVAP